MLPPAWALAVGSGFALYTFAPWLLFRFSYSRRFRFYLTALLMALLLFGGLAITFDWTAEQVRDVGVSFLIAEVLLWGFLIWQWQWECLGDPADRERRGKEQFEGRSRRQWNLLLVISPWQVYRYRQHLVEEQKQEERGDESSTLPA